MHIYIYGIASIGQHISLIPCADIFAIFYFKQCCSTISPNQPWQFINLVIKVKTLGHIMANEDLVTSSFHVTFLTSKQRPVNIQL